MMTAPLLQDSNTELGGIAIIGTVGVPGRYGGFETLAENLVHHHAHSGIRTRLTVYCSGRANPVPRPASYETAVLRYVPLNANGVQSIPYDILSLMNALWRGHDRLLLLGVSGALSLPLIRLVSRAQIVTNIDGIEWQRAKWNGLARFVLKMSEWAAVRFSHRVIADNQAIADYITQSYGRDCAVIAYGGDHALAVAGDAIALADLPERYALALCRIEPENNVHVILEAWSTLTQPLVFVGNWDNSAYGRELRTKYGKHHRIRLIDPIYEPATLRALRERACVYIHGHSAGGTNPSLVEMMHFGIPIIAHGCSFNRHSTADAARYFETPAELVAAIRGLSEADAAQIGIAMRELARCHYMWSKIGAAYFALLQT